MKLLKNLFLLVTGLQPFTLYAQSSWFTREGTASLTINGKVLANPWAGGLNAIQYSSMDLNDDGTDDLVVFDRTTGKVSTFLGDAATRSYRYQPEYEARFPATNNWMLLVDANGDGRKELFTFTQLGARVYSRKDLPGGDWQWEVLQPYLKTRGLSGNLVNLQIVAADIPALVDFDDDGDMDIITFESQGDYAELHQNISMEKYGVPDSLEFVRNGNCWGNFRKHECDDFTLGVDCGVTASAYNAVPARVLHAGNSLLLHDLNGDGRKDLLLGHVSCENISFLVNSGTGLQADFTSFTSNYPPADPVSIPGFPSAYLEDVDFDGVKDLLVSPNVYANDGNLIDFRASSWYYKNNGTSTNPDFTLRQTDFLQDQMLDVGENAAPSFFDIDGDGKQDLLIGNAGTWKGDRFYGALSFFKNTGTPAQPAFERVSEDYLELSGVIALTNLQPQWADFNGDGTPDLGITGVSDRTLQFLYFPNKAAQGQSVQPDISKAIAVTLPPELVTTDKLFFYDADQDGDLDLVVGVSQGNISYYENTGSAAQPVYTLRTSSLGGVTPNFAGRNVSLAVADIDFDGKPDLVTADISGKLKVFHGANWGEWTERDTAVVENALTLEPYAPSLGNYLHVAVADLDQDGKPDLAVGTHAGGMYLFRNRLPGTVTGTEPGNKLKVFPNPAHRQFSVHSEVPARIEIITATGRTITTRPLYAEANVPLPIPTVGWNPGVYLLRIMTDTTVTTRKVVVY